MLNVQVPVVDASDPMIVNVGEVNVGGVILNKTSLELSKILQYVKAHFN